VPAEESWPPVLHETALGRHKEKKLRSSKEGSCSLKVGRRTKKQYLKGLERRKKKLFTESSVTGSAIKDRSIHKFRGKLPPKD